MAEATKPTLTVRVPSPAMVPILFFDDGDEPEDARRLLLQV